MAAYPNQVFTKRSNRKKIPNVITNATGGGSFRARKIGPTRYLFNIEHRLISEAEAETLDAFHETNEILTFTFVWKGDTYDCQFTNNAVQINHDKGPFWTAKAQFRGTPQ